MPLNGTSAGRLRPGADRDHDLVALDHPCIAIVQVNFDGMRIQEPAAADHGLDLVAGELVLQHIDLVIEGPVQADHEILGLDVFFDAVGVAVEPALAPAGEIEDSLAQGFGGNGAGMDGHAANPVTLFDHQDGCPRFAAWMAARRPAGPLTMTMKSYRVITE